MYRKYYKPRQKKFYNREGEHLCIVCCVDLKPVPFLKINVEKKTNAYTLKTVFPDLEKNTGYMCPDCFAKIRKVTKASSKRRYILKKPVMPKKPAATKTAPIEIKGKLECDSSNYPYYMSTKSKAKVKPRPAMRQAIKYLHKSNYASLFRWIINHFKAAGEHFKDVYRSQVKKEMNKLKRLRENMVSLSQELLPPEIMEADNVPPFTWSEVVNRARHELPYLFTAIDAHIPSVQKIRKHHQAKPKERYYTSGEANALRQARLGTLLAICAFTNQPNRYNYWQLFMEEELRKEGATTKMIHILHDAGLLTQRIASRPIRRPPVFAEPQIAVPSTTTTSAVTNKDGSKTYFDEYSEITIINN